MEESLGKMAPHHRIAEHDRWVSGPCGCKYYTKQAMVVDQELCPAHQAQWDVALQRHVDEIDQRLEDEFFGKGQ